MEIRASYFGNNPTDKVRNPKIYSLQLNISSASYILVRGYIIIKFYQCLRNVGFSDITKRIGGLSEICSDALNRNLHLPNLRYNDCQEIMK